MVLIDIYNDNGTPHQESPVERDIAHKMGYWHRNSYVILCTNKGEILLHKRKGKAAYSGMWAPPADHPYTEESPQSAALRALQEEHHIEADESDLIMLTKLQAVLHESNGFTDKEFQTYFGMKWNGNPEELWINEKEASEVRLWPAYRLGDTGLVLPLGFEDLNKIKRSLVRKELLKRRHLRSPVKRNGGGGSRRLLR